MSDPADDKNENGTNADKNQPEEGDPQEEYVEAEEANPLVLQTLGSIAIGFAYYYNEIRKSWKDCGSDTLCKTENLAQYIAVILGISRPAVLLNQIAQSWLESLWTRQGKDQNESLGFITNCIIVALNIAIYAGMEYAMSLVLDWVRYATECLKMDDCEKDDILIWITNMKLRYCEPDAENDEDFNAKLDCDDYGEGCVQSEIDDDHESNLCLLFFNELPILMIIAVIYVIYMLSLSAQIKKQPQDKQIKKQEGPDLAKEDNRQPQTTSCPDKGSDDVICENGLDFRYVQEILVDCPCCAVKYADFYPDPLPIYCPNCESRGKKKKSCCCQKSEDCGANSRSKSKGKKKSLRSRSKSKSRSRPKDLNCSSRNKKSSGLHNSQISDSIEFHPTFDEDEDVVLDSEEESEVSRPDQDNSKGVLIDSSENELTGDVDEEDFTYDEIYSVIKNYAQLHQDELLAMIEEPILCSMCKNLHVDHIHELIDEDSVELNEGNGLDEISDDVSQSSLDSLGREATME